MSVYTGENVNDLSITTPTEGATPPSEVNNAIREIKDVIKNQWATIVKSAAYTLTPQDSLILVSGTTTITVPASTDVSSSTFLKEYTIIKTDAAGTNVTIARTGSDTFNGATSITLSKQYEAAEILGSGVADWKYLSINSTNVSDSITNITGDTTITAAQMTGRIRFYNSAQAAITLPAATAGLTAEFEINHSGGIRFIRNGSDTFACGGTSSLTAMPAGATYDIVVGGLYELTCYVAGVWTVKRRGVQPTFVLHKTDTQSVGTTFEKVTFATEILDNGSIVSSSRATPGISGIWKFGYRLYNGNANTDISMKVYKSGVALEYTEDNAINSSYNSNMSFSLPILVTDATQYYEIWGKCGAGTVDFYETNVQSIFWGERMSD